MSKARIHKITEKDTQLIALIPDWNTEESFFTLVDKNGILAVNDEGHGIIYKSCLPDPDMAVVEAYGYLYYWAEEECSFKEFTVQDLLTQDFTAIPLKEQDIPFMERENYQKEFQDRINAKPIRKLRRAIIEYHEALAHIDKKIHKFANYLEELDDRRENPDYEDDLDEEEEEEYTEEDAYEDEYADEYEDYEDEHY